VSLLFHTSLFHPHPSAHTFTPSLVPAHAIQSEAAITAFQLSPTYAGGAGNLPLIDPTTPGPDTPLAVAIIFDPPSGNNKQWSYEIRVNQVCVCVGVGVGVGVGVCVCPMSHGVGWKQDESL
jgi:hypothetical protein